MKKLEKLSFILLILGIIILVYGWLQGMPFDYGDSTYEHVMMVRTVKKYVFMALGAVVILNAYIVDIIRHKFIEEFEKINRS